MLILTPKVGEMIRVGDDVTVRVLEVRGGQVRLGIDAPATVRVFREEVYRARQDGQVIDAPPATPTASEHAGRDGKPPAA